jgi:AraC-like DNA-binding protein
MGRGSATYIGNATPINNLLLLNSEQNFDLKTASECKIKVLLCPIDELLGAGANQPGSLSADNLQHPGLYCPETKLHTEINAYSNYLFELSNTPSSQNLHHLDIQAIRHLVLNKLLRLWARALTADSTQAFYSQRSRYRQLVEQLKALMLNNLKTFSLTQEQLCAHVGKSQRTIYYAFNEVYGLPPMEYYKFLRFQAVRQCLKASDLDSTTVTQIATSYGFCHMGQFACDYKKLFGESPSSTLKSPSSQEDGAIATI